MKAFVYRPTSEFIGAFYIDGYEAISRELQKFFAKREAPPLYSYVEVSGRTWTIVNCAPFQLMDGISNRETLERWRQEQERLAREQQRRENQHQAVAFECVDCGTGIRLRLQTIGHAIYRCPSCKTEYKTINGKGEPSVLLVVPTSLRRGQSSDTTTKRKRQIPSDVRSALVVFALAEEATFDDARRAYREHVKQYHPDKVAHLGVELRKVAELKTKEFNAAYQVLEKFYSS